MRRGLAGVVAGMMTVAAGLLLAPASVSAGNPVLTVTPTSIEPGQSVHLEISGADSNQTLTVYWTNSSGAYMWNANFGTTDQSGRAELVFPTGVNWTPSDRYLVRVSVNGKYSNEVGYEVRASGADVSTTFVDGQEVSVTENGVTVRDAAAGNSKGTVSRGARGTIVGASVRKRLDGTLYDWWNVSFSSLSGWVTENELTEAGTGSAGTSIDAGSDVNVKLTDSAYLKATVIINYRVETRDDIVEWSVDRVPNDALASGVTFSPSTRTQAPTVKFPKRGEYILKACAYGVGCDTVTVNVSSGGTFNLGDEYYQPSAGIKANGGKYDWPLDSKYCRGGYSPSGLTDGQQYAFFSIQIANPCWVDAMALNGISVTPIELSLRYVAEHRFSGQESQAYNYYAYLGIPQDQSDFIPSPFLAGYVPPSALTPGSYGVVPSCLDDPKDINVYGMYKQWWELPSGGASNPDGSTPGHKLSTGRCIPDWRDWRPGIDAIPLYTGGPSSLVYLGNCGNLGTTGTSGEVACGGTEDYYCTADKNRVKLNETVTFTAYGATPLEWRANPDYSATPQTGGPGQTFTTQFYANAGVDSASFKHRVGAAVLEETCYVIVEAEGGGGGGGDTTRPTVSITLPTAEATYATSATPLLVSGTASDNVGVTQVTWNNSSGGSGTATCTTGSCTAWNASVALLAGTNTIRVTARDAAGNTQTDTLRVTYTTGGGGGDGLFKIGDCVEVSRDYGMAGVYSSSAANSSTWLGFRYTGAVGRIIGGPVRIYQRYAPMQGMATVPATGAWWNIYNVDFANNDNGKPDGWVVAESNLGAFHMESSTKCGTADEMYVQSCTGGTATLNAGIVTLKALGVRNALAQSFGVYEPGKIDDAKWYSGSLDSSFTYALPTADVRDGQQYNVNVWLWKDNLEQQTNIMCTSFSFTKNGSSITVTGGGGGGSTDTTPPVVTIAGPTAAATFSATTSPLSLSGTASDTRGVTQVTWTTDRGGSGTASGTTSWRASVPLSSGTTAITVTARDAAGNTARDTVGVTYATGGGGGGGIDPEPTGCDDPVGPPPPGCGEQTTGDTTLVPATYPYLPTKVRGNEPALTNRIEVIGAAGAKVYTQDEFFKAWDRKTFTNHPDGVPHYTQPKGVKGTVLRYRTALGGNYEVDFDPPGFDHATDGYVFGEDIETPYGGKPKPWQSRENTDPAYNVELTIPTPQAPMRPGEQRTIMVTVKNTGTQTLLGGGSSSSRNDTLRTDPRLARQVDWGEVGIDGLGYLPAALSPNTTVSVPVTVTAPVTGKYILRLRLHDRTLGYIGKRSNRAVITVGDPETASLDCPAGTTVVDANTQLRFRGFFSHHALYDTNLIPGVPKTYCFKIDETLAGRLMFFATDGTDNAQWDYTMKVTPPPGSGLQMLPVLSEQEPVANRADYSIQTGVYYKEKPQPVLGNYLVTVTSSRNQFVYVSSLGNTDGYVEELPFRGTVIGKTTDQNGDGVAAYVYLDSATFITRAGNAYEYQFPNLIRTGKSDYAWAGQYKVSAYKLGYTSEYRINNAAWQRGSWVYVNVPVGTITIDWKFTPEQVAETVAAGRRVRVNRTGNVSSLHVRQEADPLVVPRGEQPVETLGTVKSGPKTDADGHAWWEVDFDTHGGVNVDGWTLGSRLRTDPTAAAVAASPMPPPPALAIGNRVEVAYVDRVEVAQALPVTATPVIVGTQRRGAQGTLMSGPSAGVGGKIFWKVDFDLLPDASNVDGWVPKTALRLLPQRSFASAQASSCPDGELPRLAMDEARDIRFFDSLRFSAAGEEKTFCVTYAADVRSVNVRAFDVRGGSFLKLTVTSPSGKVYTTAQPAPRVTIVTTGDRAGTWKVRVRNTQPPYAQRIRLLVVPRWE